MLEIQWLKALLNSLHVFHFCLVALVSLPWINAGRVHPGKLKTAHPISAGSKAPKQQGNAWKMTFWATSQLTYCEGCWMFAKESNSAVLSQHVTAASLLHDLINVLLLEHPSNFWQSHLRTSTLWRSRISFMAQRNVPYLYIYIYTYQSFVNPLLRK